MITEKNKIVAIPLLILVGLTAGFFLRGFFNTQFDKTIRPPQPIIDISELKEVRAGGYEFINPLLECDNFNPIRRGVISAIESEVSSYIDEAVKTGKAKHISIYFRNLNTGTWIGINENEEYSPASLLKVPVAIAAMKRAEVDTYFLKKLIKYEQQLVNDALPNMNDTVYLKKGKVYSMEELIFHMLAGSDNEAMMLVLNNTGGALTSKVMTDLGIVKVVDGDKNDFVSVREYSSMFRLLFNATYLSKDKSEQLLSIMSKSKYNDALAAGVPAGIKLAHKFGERAFDSTTTRQLHDCGIVYLPGLPYLLCVMTRGDDFTELTKIIADISGIVYRNMEQGKR